MNGKGKVLRQIATGVKIFRPMSHNVLTSLKEIVLCSQVALNEKIVQRRLNDLGA